MNDNWPRIAYFVLLLIALGGYLIVEMRKDFGKSLRQMLAWGLIFLGLIAGFGLWDDIRKDVAPQQIVEGRRIELPMASDGHFYITLRLNGTNVDFMVDTGASDIADAPVPAKPEAVYAYWTPYLVTAAVGTLVLAGGFGLAAAFSNPTWFVLGALVFLLSMLILLRGALCSNR